MDNEIDAVLTLSGPPPDPGAVATLAQKLGTEALVRAVGERGESRLTTPRVHGTELHLTIETTGARPHQALLSMAKRLSEELGRSARIGVRNLRAPRYRVHFPLDTPPTALIRLPVPHTLSIHGGVADLVLTDLDDEALRDNWMDRAIALVQEKARRQAYTGKEQFWALLDQSAPRDPLYQGDPTEEMLKRDWVRSGPTKGKWFLGPTVAHLLRTMERIARTEVLEPLGFTEVVQPHHDSFDILLKTGHMEGLPGEFYYVTEPKTRDPAAWEEFTDLVKITRKVPDEKLRALVTGPTAVSCYAQCPTIYWWLSGRTIATESLPIRVFDRTAVSNRYESGGRHGLERVDEFHRIEPVYVGTKEQLVELREKLLARYRHVFDSILELEWRTAWVTPFYMQQAGGVGIEDAEARVKGTIDFEAWLPYRGARDKSEWLEFQNLSIVGDKYAKAFTIRTQKGEIWSGCSGIGLERWLTAFLAQKGLDAADWPDGFRRFVGDMPRDVKFL